MRPALLALSLLAAAPALAQDRPPQMTPTRDVTVTYRLTGAGEGQTLRMTHAAGPGLVRTELPGGVGWGVVDLRGGQGFLVMEPMRAIVPMPAGQVQPGVASPSARFTRSGTARIAGLDCMLWNVEDQGRSGQLCLTVDGVMLRGSGAASGRQGGLEATEVRFGRVDPALFQRPAGYQEMQAPPGMPPGLAPRR
jgi:hypothetical protein